MNIRKSLVILSFDVVDKMHSVVVLLNRNDKCKNFSVETFKMGKAFHAKILETLLCDAIQCAQPCKTNERANEPETERANVRIKKKHGL